VLPSNGAALRFAARTGTHSLLAYNITYRVRRKYRTHALLAWMGFVAFCAPRNKMPSRFRISCTAVAASSVCRTKAFCLMRSRAISLSGENGFKSADGCGSKLQPRGEDFGFYAHGDFPKWDAAPVVHLMLHKICKCCLEQV
jgi:hypothetical protein